MAFQVSPVFSYRKKTLQELCVSTSMVCSNSTTQGPLDEVTSISSEQELVSTFGKPNSTTFEGFFTAANFLLTLIL